jgi:hypothetical protein
LVGTPEVRKAFAKCGHTRENIIKQVLTEKGMGGYGDPVSFQW